MFVLRVDRYLLLNAIEKIREKKDMRRILRFWQENTKSSCPAGRLGVL
jgi:hypothetical protein